MNQGNRATDRKLAMEKGGSMWLARSPTGTWKPTCPLPSTKLNPRRWVKGVFTSV